jgi:tRNA (guanine37-N1)-methyltransferase
MLWCGIVSLFPEMFSALTQYGVTSRAVKQSLIQIDFFNPRDHAPHRRVDDRPYGGGPGMVMQVEPLEKAIAAAKAQAKLLKQPEPKVVYLSPKGQPFTQKRAKKQADAKQPLILIAGRYEGIDERLIQMAVDEQWSIGDYILTGGELAIMVVLDAVIRLIPGALGQQKSNEIESFSGNLLEYPQYTRPEDYRGLKVPEVLLSGNHVRIAAWREAQRISQTQCIRPDLLGEQFKETKADLINSPKDGELP